MVLLVIARQLSAGAESAAPATGPAEITIPTALRVDGPVIMRASATGVQIYTATADAAGALSWVLKEPKADFVTEGGARGKHSAGPTWEIPGNAKITGQKLREVPASDSAAIPWVLLKVKSQQGDGALATATYVQRINTTGGKAPVIGEAKAGDEISVPYTAQYIFYGRGAATRP